MFQPTTYQEKKAALTDILVQQLFGFCLHKAASKEEKNFLNDTFARYAQGQQALRNQEANNILGPVVYDENLFYTTGKDLGSILRLNFGRTYFNEEAPTQAPDGSIGTAGFSKKFKDFLQDLPNYDVSVKPDMATGFYLDTMTNNQHPLPMIVLNFGDEAVLISYYGGLSVLALSWPHVPADYRWDMAHHYALRGEAYEYRNNYTAAQILNKLIEALAAQGIKQLNLPSNAAEKIGELELPEGFSINYIEISGDDEKAAEADMMAAAIELVAKQKDGQELSEDEQKMLEGAAATINAPLN